MRNSSRPSTRMHTTRWRSSREVFRIHPEVMTLEELIRELTVASRDFSEHDRIQRAVRDLTAGGLLHRIGELVLPTRAAVNFDALALG